MAAIKSLLIITGVFSLIVWSTSFFTGMKLPNIDIATETFSFQQEQSASPVFVRPEAAKPKNIIVFIADGMGFSHLSLARARGYSKSKSVWDRFATVGWHRTHPIKGFLTDSAASATALATGVDTTNGAIGVDVDGNAVANLFELAEEQNYRTGVITDSYIWDATPAAFVTHSASRNNASDILKQLANSSLEVLFGELKDKGGDNVPDRDSTVKMLEKKFTILDESLNDDEKQIGTKGSPKPVAAVFYEDQIQNLLSTPTLADMVEVALERLSSNDQPFLLLVESEEPDSASHKHDTMRLVKGLESIESTLNFILDFAEKNTDTLVIFTADHETGGLVLSVKDGNNQEIQPLWTTLNHSGSVVPIMAFGPGSEYFSGIHTNQKIGQLLQKMIH